MCEILTEVEIKKHFIVGSGWIDYFNNLKIYCEVCAKPLNKQDTYYFKKYLGPVCKTCFKLRKTPV